MFESELRLTQGSPEERRANIHFWQAQPLEPSELQFRFAVGGHERAGVGHQPGRWCKMGEEIQTDLVVPLARVIEEVLSDAEQLAAEIGGWVALRGNWFVAARATLA